MPQSTSPPNPPSDPARDPGAALPPGPSLRFIIRARDDDSALSALSSFLAGLETAPQVELVDTIGPAGRPHTVVVAVLPEQARALEQRVRSTPHLMIEPDRPLSLDD